MLNFTIVVNDNGELKPVTAAEIEAWARQQYDQNGNTSLLADELNDALNQILDARSREIG